MPDPVTVPLPDPVRILSMDGGPGPMYHLLLLQEIEREYPGFIARTDVFAGTSDGALMALLLARRLGEGASGSEALAECMRFAEEYSRAFAAGASYWRFCVGHGPYTDGKAFRAVLARWFDGKTLNDLHANQRYVAVCSFNTRPWMPRFFRNFGPRLTANPDDGALTLLDVALDSSSLPGITPVHTENGQGYLDGFLSANNPAMSALSVVVRDIVRRVHPGMDPFDHVVLLSLGVGQSVEEATLERSGKLLQDLVMVFVDNRRLRVAAAQPTLPGLLRAWLARDLPRDTSTRQGVDGVAINWGARDVVLSLTYLLDMMIHGQSGEIDHQCDRLLGAARFHRYEPRIDMMRAVARFLFNRGDGSMASMTRVHDQCFPPPAQAPSARPPTDDASVNRARTVRMLAWVRDGWMADPPPVPIEPPEATTMDEGLG